MLPGFAGQCFKHACEDTVDPLHCLGQLSRHELSAECMSFLPQVLASNVMALVSCFPASSSRLMHIRPHVYGTMQPCQTFQQYSIAMTVALLPSRIVFSDGHLQYMLLHQSESNLFAGVEYLHVIHVPQVSGCSTSMTMSILPDQQGNTMSCSQICL